MSQRCDRPGRSAVGTPAGSLLAGVPAGAPRRCSRMWPGQRRASTSARPRTRRLSAEGRTPMGAAQVEGQLCAGSCAACRAAQWIPPIGRPAAPRWLRQRATASGVDQGWWGVGASLHRALADRGVGRARARAQRETSKFSFQGARNGATIEVMIGDRDLVKLWAEFCRQIPNGRF